MFEDTHDRIMITKNRNLSMLRFVSKISNNFKFCRLVIFAWYVKMINYFIWILNIMNISFKSLESITKITRVCHMSSEEIFSYGLNFNVSLFKGMHQMTVLRKIKISKYEDISQLIFILWWFLLDDIIHQWKTSFLQIGWMKIQINVSNKK